MKERAVSAHTGSFFILWIFPKIADQLYDLLNEPKAMIEEEELIKFSWVGVDMLLAEPMAECALGCTKMGEFWQGTFLRSI